MGNLAIEKDYAPITLWSGVTGVMRRTHASANLAFTGGAVWAGRRCSLTLIKSTVR